MRACAKILYARHFYKFLSMVPCHVDFGNGTATSRPRLLVEVSTISNIDHKTGIQRVAKNLFNALEAGYSEHLELVPVWASMRRKGYFLARRQGSGGELKFVRTELPLIMEKSDVFLGIDFAPAVVLAQLSFFRTLHKNGIPLHFILHDLIPITHEYCFPVGTRELHQSWLLEISRLAEITCVSQTVRSEVVDWLTRTGAKFSENKIHWMHNGYEPEDFLPPSRPFKVPPLPYFLLAGTLEPRKGHSQGLDAFERLWANGCNFGLVLAGRKGWKVDGLCNRIRCHGELNKRLFWYDDCSDGELGRLYDSAICLLSPSLAEGFGLCVLEAAARGVPLLLRDLPVYREIAGHSAFYFTGMGGNQLADTIMAWLKLYESGLHPLPADINITSWRESAAAIMDIAFCKHDSAMQIK